MLKTVPFPKGSDLTTRLLPVSAIYKLPAESTASLRGLLNAAGVPPIETAKRAAVAEPAGALRMRLLPVSAIYKFPARSSASPSGLLKVAGEREEATLTCACVPLYMAIYMA